MSQLPLPVRVVRAARRRIADKRQWTSGAAAKDANGYSINVRSPNAVAWCATGALQRAALDLGAEEGVAADLFGLVAHYGDGRPLVEINDGGGPGSGHGAVLAAFDDYLFAHNVDPDD